MFSNLPNVKTCTAVVFLALMSAVCHAQTTRYVNASVSGGANNGTSWANAYANLQTAIDACTTGDNIDIATGDYFPTKDHTGNTNPADARSKTFYIKDGIKLYGGYNAATGLRTGFPFSNSTETLLKGDIGSTGNTTDNCYHVITAAPNNSTAIGVTLDGLSIRDGNANGSSSITINSNFVSNDFGGGICLYNGTNTLENLTVYQNNAASFGGGIYINGGTNSFNICTVGANTTPYKGGGVYLESGNTTMLGCAMYRNTAVNDGGGISASGGTLTLNSNRITENKSSSKGGGVHSNATNSVYTNNLIKLNEAEYGGGAYIDYSTNSFTNNIVTDNKTTAAIGGGLYLISNTDVLKGNVVSNNSSANAGGGVCFSFNTATVLNNLICGNTANNNGSGVYMDNSAVTFTNNTFADNNAIGTGGVYLATGTATLNSNIFWGNKKNGITISSGADYERASATVTSKNNFFQLITSSYTTTGSSGGAYDIGIGASSNIFATNPLFTDATNPRGADNAFRTADDGYIPQFGSPVEDAGLSAGAPATDIIGVSRASGVDAGAYESKCASITLPPTALSFHNITTTTINAEWNKGNGNRTFIVVKEGSAANLSGVLSYFTYTADANFDSSTSSSINGGKVVYFGSSDNVTITGLTPNTKYYLTIVSANACGGYLVNSPLTGFVTTTTTWVSMFKPTSTVTGFPGAAGASNANGDGWPNTEAPNNATDGNRTSGKYLNFQEVNSGVEVTITTPYIAKRLEVVSVSEAGAEGRNVKSIKVEGKLGSSGTYTLIAQTVLPENADPNIAHFVEFDNNTAYDTYKITAQSVYGANVMQVRELQLYGTNGCATLTTQVNALSFYDINTTNVNVEWNKGNGNRTLVIAKPYSAADASSVMDDTPYTANTDFSDVGSSTIDGGKVVYFGTNDNVTVTGLSPNVKYYFTIITAADCYAYLTPTPVTGFVTTDTTMEGVFRFGNEVTGFPGTAGQTNGWHVTEAPARAIDGDRTEEKFLNFNENNSGLVVSQLTTSIVRRLEVVCISESGYLGRNPKTMRVEGKMGASGTYALLTEQTLPRNTSVDATHFIDFDNSNPYNTYRITVVNVYGGTEMQLREVQLYGTRSCPTRLYVNAAAVGSNTGGTWANAFPDLQTALATACDNTEIWVAKGTYKPSEYNAFCFDYTDSRSKTFFISDGIKVYGGFAGTESSLADRVNNVANTTILSGDIDNNNTLDDDNTYHTIVVRNAASSTTGITLDRLTIKDGYADGGNYTTNSKTVTDNNGAGIQIKNGVNTFQNLIVTNNYAFGTGGGIETYSGTNNFNGCVFTDNTTDASGGAIYTRWGTNNVENCIFTDNVSDGNGGAIAVGSNVATPSSDITSNQMTIQNTTFEGNSGAGGGAIRIIAYTHLTYKPTTTLTNCLFVQNTALSSSTDDVSNSLTTAVPLILTNCLLQKTSSDYANDEFTLNNCIYHPNAPFADASNAKGADGVWRTADDGLRLVCSNPALDKGTNTGAPAVDILGNATYNTTKDIGAYESQTDWANTIYTGTSTCDTYTIYGVSGTDWYPIYGKNGIIASIQPNQDLGDVSITISDPTTTSTYNGKKFMGRNIDVTATNTPTTNYNLRLYYYDTELDDYKTAEGNASLSINDLNMVWSSGGTGCTLADYIGSATSNGLVSKASITPTEYGAANNGFALTFALDHFTIFAPTIATSSALPVTLLSFTGRADGDRNRLQWTTATERDATYFNVEHSADGVNFKAIGNIKASNKADGSTYSLDDNTPFNLSYYRLQSIDTDGSAEYSPIISIYRNGRGFGVERVYPNPTTNNTTVVYTAETNTITTFTLTNALGVQLSSVSAIAQNGSNVQTINMNNLTAGVYFLTIYNEGSGAVIRKIVKE